MQKNLQNVIKIFTLAVMLLVVNVTFAQVTIGGWEMNGLSNSGVSPFAATTTASNTTVGGLTKGSGVSSIATGAAGSAWGGNNFSGSTFANAVTTNQFVTFTVKANSGYTLSLTQISPYNVRRSGTGPTTGRWQYTVNGGTYTDIGTDITWTGTTTNSQAAIALSGITALQNIGATSTITFRLVLWGATGTAGTWYINDPNTSAGNDFVITGTVTAVSTNAAPTATVNNITGNTTAGSTLTGSYTYADAESDIEGTSTKQWYRADNAAGTTNKTAISAATASTYTITAADAGKYISYAVVPKAQAGTLTGTEAYSNWLLIPNYALTYNGNSNTGGTAPASSSYLAGTTVTLPVAGTLVRTGYIFTGWNTLADGTGTSYAAGATYTMPASATTLYAKWVVDTTPALATSPASLTGFTYINNSGPSANQSFSLSGTSLTGTGNITITAPTNYEVSLTTTGDFGASVLVPYSSATLASTPVYVRLKSGLGVNTSYAGSISISGGGATASVSVSGSVTNQVPTATSPVVTGNNYIVGTTLTGSFTYSDYEGDPQGTSTYKWYTATTSTGTGSAVISGATATTFTLTSTQSGKYIQYSVTPVASAGSTTGVETKSGWYGPVVTPIVAVTPGTLTGFAYMQGSGPSAPQSFSVSGSNLNGTTLTATGSTNYEVCLTSAGTYTSSITIPYTGNALSTTPVYVRLKSGLAIGSYNNQSITVSGAGATSATVTVSGSVTLANDDCSGAVVLSVGTTATSGTLSNATDSGLGASSCGGNPDDDVWYTFTTTVAGSYTITATPTNTSSLSIDFVNQIFSGSCGNLTSVACIDTAPSGSPEILTAALLANTTYYVRVYDLYDNSSPPVNYGFNIKVTAPAPSIITSPTTIAFGSQENGTISAAQSFTLTAAALNPVSGNVALSTAAPFQISSNGTTWGTSLSLAYTNYALSSTVQVRYNPTTYTASSGTISISGGGATASVALTGTGVIGAPVATAASLVAPSTFNANWNAVTNASGYRLDVATSSEFVHTTLSEDFSLFTDDASSGSALSTANFNNYFQITGWSGTNVYDVVGVPGYARLGSGSALGSLVTPSLDLSANGGAFTLNFDVKRYNTDALATIQIWISINNGTFTKVGSDLPLTAGVDFVTKTVSITGATANTKIRIQNTAADQRFNLDNIKLSYSNILPSYNNITVSALTQLVSSLAENTTYYYRVRAVNTASSLTSPNSNTITVTTGKTLTWTGATWTYGATTGVTPTASDDGTIAAGATYNTPSNLIIGNLTVNATGIVNIPSNRTITIARNLVNNAPAANFTVQDNGALVQTATGVATNTTPITVIKNSNPLYRLDYTLWSSPVAGQILRQFSMGTSNNRFYEYKLAAGDEGYFPIDDIITRPFAAAKSYLIRMPNSVDANVTGTTNGGTTTPAQYTAGTGNYYFQGKFAGTPYTGDITYNNTAAGSVYAATGNPYPSPINIAAFYATNSGVIDGSSAIYFWRKKNNTDTSSSSYASITLADFNFTPNTGASGTGGQANADYYSGNSTNWTIAPGQGFFVKATGTITFNNAMRKPAPAANGQAFFKSGVSQVSRFRMKVSKPEGDASQMSVVYMPEGTLGLDYGYDGKLLGDANLSIYTLAQNTSLAIQARPEFDVTDVVPAGFTADVAGSFSIGLSYTDGVFANGQKVYLKDKAEGIIRDMAQGDYTFTSEAGTFNDRFEILYATTALGVATPVLDANTIIVYQNGSSININSGSALISSVNVFDIRGRKLYTAEKVNATEAAINNLTAAKQVLIVEVNTDKGTVTKKIVF